MVDATMIGGERNVIVPVEVLARIMRAGLRAAGPRNNRDAATAMFMVHPTEWAELHEAIGALVEYTNRRSVIGADACPMEPHHHRETYPYEAILGPPPGRPSTPMRRP